MCNILAIVLSHVFVEHCSHCGVFSFQIEACFKIMGVPQIDMSEMTGNVAVNIRKEAWKQKRIFFLTPQVKFRLL